MKQVSAKVNLISLFVFHGVNTVTAAVAFPWALAIFGPVIYSQLVFSEAIILLMIPVVVYGFDLVAVRTILRHTDPTEQRTAINKTFPVITLARAILFIVASAAAIAITAILHVDRIQITVAWLLLLLGWALQPTWYFQATQNHLPIAVSAVFSRILFGTIGFVIIPETNSPFIFALFYGGAIASGAALSFAYVAWCLKSRFWVAPFSAIYDVLREGFMLFLSSFSVSSYRGLGVILMELLGVGPALIAAYSLIEKITKALQAASRPLNQYFMPKIVQFVVSGYVPIGKLFHRLAAFSGPQLAFLGALWMAVIVTFFSIDASKVFSLESLPDGHVWGIGFVVMAAASFFGILNFVYGATALNAIGGEGAFFVCVLIAGFVAVSTLVMLLPKYGDTGAYIAFFLGEFSLFIGVVVSLINLNQKGRA